MLPRPYRTSTDTADSARFLSPARPLRRLVGVALLGVFAAGACGGDGGDGAASEAAATEVAERATDGVTATLTVAGQTVETDTVFQCDPPPAEDESLVRGRGIPDTDAIREFAIEIGRYEDMCLAEKEPSSRIGSCEYARVLIWAPPVGGGDHSEYWIGPVTEEEGSIIEVSGSRITATGTLEAVEGSGEYAGEQATITGDCR